VVKDLRPHRIEVEGDEKPGTETAYLLDKLKLTASREPPLAHESRARACETQEAVLFVGDVDFLAAVFNQANDLKVVPLAFEKRFPVYFLCVNAFEGLEVDSLFASDCRFRLTEYFFLFHCGFVIARNMSQMAAIDVLKEETFEVVLATGSASVSGLLFFRGREIEMLSGDVFGVSHTDVLHRY
jgi:hypothetical protein